MSTELTKWTKDDVSFHMQLDELLSKNAEWKMNTGDSVKLYRCLVWFASIRKKIEQSQAEVLSVRKIEPESEVKKARKARVKATNDASAQAAG